MNWNRPDIVLKTRYNYLLLNIVLVTLSAFFIYDWRTQVVTALLLFLPFIDSGGSQIKYSPYQGKGLLRSLFVAVIVLLIYFYPDQQNLAISTLVFTALPEEWFFRAYLMLRLECLIQDISQSARVRGIYQKIYGNKNNYNEVTFSTLVVKNTANITTSVFFALMHLPVQGWVGLMVFFPSLLFGWLYQKTSDLFLVILLHGLSNLVFVIFIQKHWF